MEKKKVKEQPEVEEIREVIIEKKSGFNLVEVLVIVVIAILFGVFIGSAITYARESTTATVTNKVPGELKEFVSTYEDIVANYYDNIDKKKLIGAGIQGMVDYLEDPYAVYMDETATEAFNQQVEGHYVGIGVEVMQMNGVVSITQVFDNGPSKEAGLKAGDIIKTVDSKSTDKLSLDEITKLIKGKENTKVTLGILRGEENLEIEVTRKDVDIISVSSKTYEKNGKKIGSITIDVFASNTAEQFKKELEALEKQKIDSLIIDVRYNPGGHLTQVSEMVSLFLPKSKIIYQLETKGIKEPIYSLTKEKRKYPIAVLVNQSSASASEILAAAMKESYGAEIVGTKTYGKGTVQDAYTLSSGATVKYTTQKWLTPDGNWIDGKGVTPTIEVEQSEAYQENPIEENDAQLLKAIEVLSQK